MAIADTFGAEEERVLANFDFLDIATGLGYVAYFGINMETSGGQTYVLDTQQLYSSNVGTRNNAAATVEMNFDTSVFNLPRRAKGTAYFSCPLHVAGAGTVRVTVQLIVFDGSTETTISSEITSNNVTGSPANEMILIPIPITETNIKVGDLLRAEVKFINDGPDNAEIGHDPRNRDGDLLTPSTEATITTSMRLNMPFKIDV